MESIKEFINEAKKTISKESMKVNKLHREIDEYETLIYVVGKTDTTNLIDYYKEKINQCQNEIDKALENIKSSKNRIAIMNKISKIVKRGEKCA